MKTLIFKDYKEFSQREDKNINGVNQKFANKHPYYEAQNSSNINCWNCRGLKNKKLYFKNKKYTKKIPKIENIHQKVLAGCLIENQFDMDYWHYTAECGTTHCRSGMNVYLAGKAGDELEAETFTLFASMLLYAHNSDIEVASEKYFVSNDEAIADMQRCAELEKQA